MRDVAGIFPAMEAPRPGGRVGPGPGTLRAGGFAFWLLLAVLLGGCSTLQFSYNNAETALRYMAWDYLDANAEQSDSLQDGERRHEAIRRRPRKVQFHPERNRIARGGGGEVGR